MIDPRFLNLLFSTASIERWNDQIRPVVFVELDKQAHKMIIAWLLARIEEEENGARVDWNRLIAFGIVEFAYRAVLTDLKPPVFHHLFRHRRDELNAFVERELEPLCGEKLKEIFREYVASNEGELERRILSAAHFLASRWEYRFIHSFAPDAYDVQSTWEHLEGEVEEYLDLTGVRRLEMGKKSRQFLELCAMLRFQKRWAKTQRLPQTSVLGHMLFVAVVSWLLSLEYGACEKKRVNNFYAGLFHDIAESLTRDIISPVKYGVKGLDQLLSSYEQELVEGKLLPLLPRYLRDEMRYFVTDEFANKIRTESGIETVDDPEWMRTRYNEDCYNGIDGSLVKVADHLGAYMEAAVSLSYGVGGTHLREARTSLLQQYRGKTLYGMDLGALFGSIEDAL